MEILAMSFRTPELALIVSCVAALGGSPLTGFAQSNPRQNPPPGNVAGQLANTPATNSAQFSQVPMPVPFYPTNPYVNYNGPIGGYLSGAADVIGAQGQFLTSTQQAYIQREQARQARIDTRRRNFDENLYERAKAPTLEDERERARIEQLRRSRNNPPITEIWSGRALNDLLQGIQQQFARKIDGPNVPLELSVLSHINVTGSQTGGSLGLLRQDGRLDWPFTLRAPQFKADREKLDQLAYKAYKQAATNSVDFDTIQGMTTAANSMMTQLQRDVNEISANDYIQAKRFLNQLNETITILQSPNVAKYVNQTWSARGNTVGELTREMTNQGLRFAPATVGDQAAYVALHSAMVAFFVPPDTPWDPLAK
jgi:hypothetical protein